MKKFLELSLIMTTIFLVSCAGEGDFGPPGPSGWGPMMLHGFEYGGMFVWIIFLICLGLLIYCIAQGQSIKGQTPTRDESPLDILKRRYAKGEITREEYAGMKKDLMG